MINKEKIAISIDSVLLEKIDEKVDKINFKSRSNVIESLIREWLKLKEDIWWLIIANDNNWNDSEYPLDIPKCLIEIDGITILEKNINILRQSNINDIYISVGHQKDKIINFLQKKWLDKIVKLIDSDIWDLSWKVVNDSELFQKYNKLVVFLWDNYHHDFNLLDFIYYHNTNNTHLSVVVQPIDASKWYWNIKLEWNNIVKFVEKPITKEDISFIVNTGIYIIDWDVLPNKKSNFKLETEFFPDYVQNNRSKAYFHNGKWFHVQDNKTLDLLK